MRNTIEKYPFWLSRPEDVTKMLAGIKKGKVHTLCTSAGGREIPYVTYGEKENYNNRANWSSACGAYKPECYADRAGKRPTFLLFGATHGQETESIMALMNLISLIETGRDLRGKEVPWVTEGYEKSNCRLIIVPTFNIDGRCRFELDSLIDEPMEALRHYGQGRWKNGELCGWPGCKMVHPIKDEVSFLGAYFNDDGINLMHDNFFAPMAQETVALMKLVSDEAPDCVINMHGGDNCTNNLGQPSYAPLYIREEVFALANEVDELAKGFGLSTFVSPIKDRVEGYPPPTFNLTSAIFHACGAVVSTYESNQGMAEKNQFMPEDILQLHYCLFAGIFNHDWRRDHSAK